MAAANGGAVTCQRPLFRRCLPVLVSGLAALAWSAAQADEKEGMPDLAQIEQTCLPTSTANLILWFGHHGYPKLIMDGATPDERELRTVHQIMTDTGARFDIGTRMEGVTSGIQKYINDAGYACDVEYRGVDSTGTAFQQDWLKENDAPNKGFILLLFYCHADAMGRVFTPAWNAGHAVTLVNADPDAMLIHDPAHENDETGRKIITPTVIHEGTLSTSEGSTSVAGLMLLSGTLLEGPEDSTVMVSGAVRITMHPPGESPAGSTSTALAGATQSTIAGTAPSAPAPPAASHQESWFTAIFNFLFDK